MDLAKHLGLSTALIDNGACSEHQEVEFISVEVVEEGVPSKFNIEPSEEKNQQ